MQQMQRVTANDHEKAKPAIAKLSLVKNLAPFFLHQWKAKLRQPATFPQFEHFTRHSQSSCKKT